MWEVSKTSLVSEDYSYGRCVQLQLLADHVRELKQQLDLRITCKPEVIGKSNREVSTPRGGQKVNR